MDREEAVRRVLYDYLEAGLVAVDPDRVLELVAEDVAGFGMGEQGFISSKKEMRDIILGTMREDRSAEYELNYPQVAIRFLSETSASVCAIIDVACTQGGETAHSGLMQSLTLRFEGGRWLIVTLHASPVNLTQESIDAYPLRYAEHSLAQLRSQLQSETFDLIMHSISGGILGSYAGDGVFPLYFANDSMLAYLGYSREEFSAAFSGDVLGAVHPDDREDARRMLARSCATGEDHGGRLRVLKKDGSFLWMLERGRRSAGEDGRAVVMSVFVDITEIISLQEELRRRTEELSVSEERFRIALEKTSNIIFDYDLISGNIMHSSAPKHPLDFVTNVRSLPETLVMGGHIAGESVAQVQEAFEAIRRGERQASCTARVELAGGGRAWNRISMTAVCDEAGRTVRAIGMIEDITEQREAELAYAREEQYRQAILSDAMAAYIVNFTEDRFENCEVRDPRCAQAAPGASYDAFILSGSRLRMEEEDRRAFLGKFSRVSVMEAFDRGENELQLDYHVINLDGTDMWMQTTLRLLYDVATHEKKGFLYVSDIDERKRRELALTRRSERDPLTGLYNKGVTEARIRDMLCTNEGIRSGVFMMIDFDHFKEINDTFGHPFGDQTLADAAHGIAALFREGDIVGRLGGDEFCVFFCGVLSQERVEEAARGVLDVFARLFAPQPGQPAPSCSVGVSRCGGTAKTFEQLYREADSALYAVKKAGRAGFQIYGG